MQKNHLCLCASLTQGKTTLWEILQRSIPQSFRIKHRDQKRSVDVPGLPSQQRERSRGLQVINQPFDALGHLTVKNSSVDAAVCLVISIVCSKEVAVPRTHFSIPESSLPFHIPAMLWSPSEFQRRLMYFRLLPFAECLDMQQTAELFRLFRRQIKPCAPLSVCTNRSLTANYLELRCRRQYPA